MGRSSRACPSSPTGIGPGADVGRSPATVEGQAEAVLVPLDQAGVASDLGPATLLRERLPIRDPDGQVLGVVSVWRDGGPILARLDSLRFEVVMVTLTAALVAAILLFFIFRSAQSRLTRQTAELIEATRRDALTGTLNHGALVGLVAGRIEAARASGETVGVALVDVDNFTLLNDNHGHRVGDAVLQAVLEELRAKSRRTPSSAGTGPTSSWSWHRPVRSSAWSRRSRVSVTASSNAVSTSNCPTACRSPSVPASRRIHATAPR